MLNRFLQLFKSKSPAQSASEQASTAAAHGAEFNRLNELAPVISTGSALPTLSETDEDIPNSNAMRSSTVCREAVLNKAQRVAGYSFALSHNVNERVRSSSTLVQRVYDEVLLRNILNMDIQRLLGHRLAFIPILPSTLTHPLLAQLPPAGTVLVVNALEQLLADAETSLAQLNTLKKTGFHIALQGNINAPGMQPFLELAEFVFIDIGGNDLPTITDQINEINKSLFDKHLVATNVKTLDEYHVCAALPFMYIQGTFVTSREAWTKPSLDAGRIKILELLNRIRQDAENAELAQALKLDPALSFKILRYINSAGSGLTTKVSTIDQALMILGRQNLYRWLTLLLFTSGAGEAMDWALMENALVRARLAELSAGDALPARERDELFVTGIFSLLDILLRLPMEQVLAQINLPAMSVEALLHKTGKYAPYLELAIACEAFDQERITAIAHQLGIDVAHVNAHHADALIWAEQVSS